MTAVLVKTDIHLVDFDLPHSRNGSAQVVLQAVGREGRQTTHEQLENNRDAESKSPSRAPARSVPANFAESRTPFDQPRNISRTYVASMLHGIPGNYWEPVKNGGNPRVSMVQYRDGHASAWPILMRTAVRNSTTVAAA